jgi:hypothetical protein
VQLDSHLVLLRNLNGLNKFGVNDVDALVIFEQAEGRSGLILEGSTEGPGGAGQRVSEQLEHLFLIKN